MFQTENLVPVLCLGRKPKNGTVQYPNIRGNKIEGEEICEMEPTGGTLWWPKSEPCSKLK